jgi:ATP-dependent helicase Lhr and Lhr-like helicase
MARATRVSTRNQITVHPPEPCAGFGGDSSLKVLDAFHPVVRDWFRARFGEPTEVQRLGWKAIRDERDVLLAAPTGSGKTLAAFLVCIDRLLRGVEAGTPTTGTDVLYISPLKALSNDIRRNLEDPLAEITAAARNIGIEAEIRALVRTGDTPQSERQAMVRRPPQILVTTPESLYLLVTSERSRAVLSHVRTVIVDEIHAMARDKRGSHLSLTLARLDQLCVERPVRIGLSATQRPMEGIARFLVGTNRVDKDGVPDCHIIDTGHDRPLDLGIEVPPTELQAVCSGEQWGEVYQRIVELVLSHRGTLVFVNTRRLAERIAHRLTEHLGAEAIASHHGSLSKELRQSAEARLKAGTLKAIVATGSLEMGIDVGYIDLVCQIGSPRSIATFLQRVGRSGHSLGKIPRGRLFPLTRDELLECMALIRAVRARELDKIVIPDCPLDILAQQMVATISCGESSRLDLWHLCRTAWPYRNLSLEDFDAVLKVTCEGVSPSAKSSRHIHHDKVHDKLRPRRGARLAALTSGGAIPDTGQFRVVTADDATYIGQLDEDFAIESTAGEIFVLGTNSWQIVRVREGEVVVRDAHGAPPTIPFWIGESPGRTPELSRELSKLRQEIGDRLPDVPSEETALSDENLEWLKGTCAMDQHGARQALLYVAAQKGALGIIPTDLQIVFERFFDESGGMQLVIHAPLGARINRAWGLALRKRFCRSFDFELQAAATDDGVLLSLGPQHSFPIESLFRMVQPDNAAYLLKQALLAVPMFGIRWRWNVTRSLAVLRQRGGKRVPFFLQRYRSDDLLAAVFPETVGCLENHHGDVEIPDHPLVQQTMHDCLHEAMDLDGWKSMLEQVQSQRIQMHARETREPSPFSHQLLNASPYAFLDGAALEERRTRAISTRQGLSLEDLRDLARLDPLAIQAVIDEAQPLPRNADEMHELLCDHILIDLPVAETWTEWLESLRTDGRSTQLMRPNGESYWVATEKISEALAIHADGVMTGDSEGRPPTETSIDSSTALVTMLRGWVPHLGPVNAEELAQRMGLRPETIAAGMEALEGDGTVLRGHFRSESPSDSNVRCPLEWCDRGLLARIQRRTLHGLRKQIQAVQLPVFVQYVQGRQRIGTKDSWTGTQAVREVIGMFQGCQLPASIWESHILSTRIPDYDPSWLDQLFAMGEVVWGRPSPPKGDESRENSSRTLHRSVTLSLMEREDLTWLIPAERVVPMQSLRTSAREIFEQLLSAGALFYQQIVQMSGLLPAYVEEGLRELSAWGLVTSDSFAAVRQFISKRKDSSRRRSARRLEHAPGRWSLFPGALRSTNPTERREKWCQQLLKRWGVVCRDIVEFESASPSWGELVPVFRSLERRGEIRGGRFVLGISGEQFATEASLAELRAFRVEEARKNDWIAVSAADPFAHLSQLTLGGAKIPANAHGSLIVRAGEVAAVRSAGETRFLQEIPLESRVAMERALWTGRGPS